MDAAGDVNGGGFSDVIIGVLWEDNASDNNAGNVYVWFASASGLDAGPADWMVVGNQEGVLYGYLDGTGIGFGGWADSGPVDDFGSVCLLS